MNKWTSRHWDKLVLAEAEEYKPVFRAEACLVHPQLRARHMPQGEQTALHRLARILTPACSRTDQKPVPLTYHLHNGPLPGDAFAFSDDQDKTYINGALGGRWSGSRGWNRKLSLE